HWTLDEANLHSPDSAWVKQTLRSTGDVKQSNLIRQPDGSVAYLVDFEGPSLQALPEDAEVRSQVSVGDNGEIVENSVRYNPETKGWRLTLRLKIKDPSKATEMRAALVRPLVPVELPATSHSVNTLAKADKVAKQQSEKEKANEQAAEQKEAKAVKASTAAAEPTPTPQEPEQTEQVLTETWSYQLPADE
ncbi:MAG: glucan biosynthesis protein, partial [Pseudomonas sp.]